YRPADVDAVAASLPGDAHPEAVSAESLAPGGDTARLGRQVGHGSRNRRQRGAEGERQADERTLEVTVRGRLGGGGDADRRAETREQPGQLRLHAQQHLRATPLREVRIAAELQRVTERLLRVDEQGPAGERLRAVPARRGERRRPGGGAVPATRVQRQPVREIPREQ